MNKKRLFLILFLLFTLLFWFSRLWNFERLITFHSDQGTFFLESWEMVRDLKPRLIGLKVSTKEVMGRAFFTGPFFYYLLAFLGLITSWNPIIITLMFLFFWWLVGIGVWYLVKKISGDLAAMTAYGIFSVFPFLVEFSRIIWNSGFLSLISVFFFGSLYFLKKRPTNLLWLLAGLFFGLGLNINYAAFLWIPILGTFYLWGLIRRRWKFLPLIFLGLGFILGELPLIVFELRHSLYNTRTIIFFIQKGVLGGRTQGPVTDYHFIFALLPLFFLVWGKIIKLIEKNLGFKKAFVLSILLIIGLTISINWQQEWGTGMPRGWTLAKEQTVARQICEEMGEQAFEVAETIDGDTRAHDLRFFLSFYGCPPLGVEDYQSADVLFLVAPKDRHPGKETVWEVKSLKPFKIEYEKNLEDNLFLFKLRREASFAIIETKPL